MAIELEPLSKQNKDVVGMDKSFTSVYKGKLLEVEYFGTLPTDFVRFSSGIVTSFSDSFKANWTETMAIGKMDSIASYSNTIRSINTGLLLVAESPEAAQRNLAHASKLAQFSYPSYNPDGDMIRPFVRLRLMNLISDGAAGGLYGYLKEVTLQHVLDDIVFFDKAGNAYPKEIQLNISFEVLHTDSLGFDQTDFQVGLEEFTTFPYGIGERNKDVNLTSEEVTPGADGQVTKLLGDATSTDPNGPLGRGN